jgi:hypothetical protein
MLRRHGLFRVEEADLDLPRATLVRDSHKRCHACQQGRDAKLPYIFDCEGGVLCIDEERLVSCNFGYLDDFSTSDNFDA